LEEFFGQEHALEEKALLSSLFHRKEPLSLLLWGPPGCGKTTLARIYTRHFVANTFFFHPASHGTADLKKWVQEIQNNPLFHTNNLIFVDEIHRLSKAQQDAFLPFLEDGTFCIVGATTENPSFALTGALLSRLRVIPLQPLNDSALEKILERALSQMGITPLTPEDCKLLIQEAKGDARHLLNCVENLLSSQEPLISGKISSYISSKATPYDRSGDEHYHYISCLHKAVRGSDPDAALYWLCRMLEAGEDPNYIARRLLRISIEDIGLADPDAQKIALQGWQTYERLGSPEGDLALAEVAIFLALSPKSTSSYKAFNESKEIAKTTSSLPPPPFLMNAPTKLLQSLGFGKGYIYDPDTQEKFSGQNYFPETMDRPYLYKPSSLGLEKELKRRLDFFTQKRNQINTP
jgi:putative ATPase